MLSGAIYATKNADIKLKGINGNSVANVILSSARGNENAGLGEKEVVSAVYAANGANVKIDAGESGFNYIASSAELATDEDRERTVWAYKGAHIDLSGNTTIIASNADVNTDSISGAGNSKGVAVTAGTGVWSSGQEPDFNIPDAERSIVNINGDANITGDVVSAYDGLLNINTDGKGTNYNHSTVLQGNALAGNGGKLNINLGEGGIWYGRADDYGDAGVVDNGHKEFFAPAFSSAISQGGQVNITMGNNSTWFVE